MWEVRRRYPDREHYLAEIAARTGRSILHELADAEMVRWSTSCGDGSRTGPSSSGTGGRSGGAPLA